MADITIPGFSKEVSPRYFASTGVDSRAFFVFSVYAFRATLDMSYLFYLSVSFLSDPITPMAVHLRWDRLLLSYAMLAPICVLVPFGKKGLSGIFFLAALAFLYVPMTSLVGLNADREVAPLLLVGLAVLVSRIWTAAPLPDLPIPKSVSGIRVAIALSFLSVTVFMLWSVISGAARVASLSLDEIYVRREEMSRLLDVGIMAYLNLWAQKVFNPFLIAVGLFYKKYFLAALCIILQFYFFAVTQHRTHLFVPVLVLLVYILYTIKIRISYIYLLMSACLMTLLVASAYADLETLLAIGIRRAFFVAPSVAYDWIVYFQSHPRVYFSDRLLKDVVTNTYTGANLPNLMSQLMGFSEPFGFNVGVVGAGFAQLGVMGVVFYASALGGIVWIVNSLIKRGLPPFIAAAVLFEPLRIAWADSDLFAALLSHGLLVGLVLLWIHGPCSPVRRNKTAAGHHDRVPASGSPSADGHGSAA